MRAKTFTAAAPRLKGDETMTHSKTAICAALITASLCGIAGATVYTFQPSSGDWDDPMNWNPRNTPGAGDTANIGANQTCTVADADQAVGILNVASGGKLQINNRHLAMDGDGTVSPSMTINGTVEFLNTSTLTTGESVTIGGSGQLATVSGGTAYVGPLLEDTSVWVTINNGVTLKGSFKFYANVHNDGVLAVDAAGQDMEIGEADPALTSGPDVCPFQMRAGDSPALTIARSAPSLPAGMRRSTRSSPGRG
jgi:hypothetical protein